MKCAAVGPKAFLRAARAFLRAVRWPFLSSGNRPHDQARALLLLGVRCVWTGHRPSAARHSARHHRTALCRHGLGNMQHGRERCTMGERCHNGDRCNTRHQRQPDNPRLRHPLCPDAILRTTYVHDTPSAAYLRRCLRRQLRGLRAASSRAPWAATHSRPPPAQGRSAGWFRYAGQVLSV